MKYLLDTCTISDFIKGDVHTLQKIKYTSPLLLTISSITVMEIHYGLSLNKDRAAKIQNIVDQFLSKIEILPFDKEDARISGLIRAELKERGSPIGSYDILLAGCALSKDLIFVTSNTSEFCRIDRLKLENWRLTTH